jgi:DNA polymerase I
MKDEGLPVSVGMLIEYYIAESDKKRSLVRERARMVGDKDDYDIDYYLNKQILPSVENIFEVFNVDTKELVEGKKQMKLGEF